MVAVRAPSGPSALTVVADRPVRVLVFEEEAAGFPPGGGRRLAGLFVECRPVQSCA